MTGRRPGGTRSILADVGDSGLCGAGLVFYLHFPHNSTHKSTLVNFE